jgi:hypothetical protein
MSPEPVPALWRTGLVTAEDVGVLRAPAEDGAG